MESDNFRTLVDRVKERIDIVTIIERHLKLDRNHKALCPFHDDTEPSFSVNKQGQYYHCFGCGAGGDVIDFIKRHTKISFMEALSVLAKEALIDLPDFTPELKEQIRKERTREEILLLAATYYQSQLTDEAGAYLRDRGFTDNTIDKFRIGWANGQLHNQLINHHRLNVEECIAAGVICQNANSKLYDHFRNRMIFPNIYHGWVVHLTGRVIGEEQPKYLHLPGRINHFFNENALRNKTVLITEGVTDAISAEQAGHPAIALYGVSGQKPEQIAKLSRCDRIYLCLDGDSAGMKSAQKLAAGIGNRSRIVQLPEGDDLCSFLSRNKPEMLKELLSQAKDLITYKIDAIPSDIDKIELSDSLIPVLQLLANTAPAKAEAYLSNDMRKRFGLNREEVEAYRQQVKLIRNSQNEKNKTKGRGSQERPNYSAKFDGLVDVVEQDGEPAYLVKQGDAFIVCCEYEINGVLNTPPRKEKIPWLLPNGERVLGLISSQDKSTDKQSCATLFDDLTDYLFSVSELPHPVHYDLFSAWVLHTYLIENVHYTPIICLFAVPARGKTRTGSALINLAYRGIRVESLREAYLFRIATYWGAAVFFDVMDLWRKAERENSTDILLSRFEPGSLVPRVLDTDKGPFEDTSYFKVFGPTVIGTNKNVHHILETRAIQINMPEATRPFDNPVTPESALHLKERLLAFRARHMCQALPEVSKIVSGRLGDILKPLHQMIMLTRPEREADFIQLAQSLQRERQMDKSDSIEAQILRTIFELSDRVVHGKLPVKDIADCLNRDRPERFHTTPHTVGRRLSSMGFSKGRTSTGGSALLWDQEMLVRVSRSYGLQETSETSVFPPENICKSDITDVSDVSAGTNSNSPAQ